MSHQDIKKSLKLLNYVSSNNRRLFQSQEHTLKNSIPLKINILSNSKENIKKHRSTEELINKILSEEIDDNDVKHDDIKHVNSIDFDILESSTQKLYQLSYSLKDQE